jgi:WD40 repeat protein
MPIYSRPYAEVFERATSPERAVRRYLSLLEADLREVALIAMASWRDAAIPRELWKPASANLFQMAAGLQEPTFGRWNGMLHALREALACVGTRREAAGSPQALATILEWLRAPAEPEAIDALRALAPLLYYNLPARASRWDAISLGVCLRNRVTHDPIDAPEWWSTIASGVRPICASFAAIPPCLDREALVFPRPWFLERGGIWHAYSGIRGNRALYSSPVGESFRVPLGETELIAAFQHILGQAELQQSSFRELMKRLAPEEHRGVLVGDFLLGPPVAEGGFAVVHRGYQLSLDRKVALKVFPDALTQSKRALLRREAERLGAFDAPEIVRLIGFYEEIPWAAPRDISLSDEPWFEAFKKGSGFKTFLAMEWIDGEDLAAVFERPPEEQPGLDVLVEWLHACAEALAKVHAAGLTHMDVTPNNIRVTREGQVKLMDFGIARSETERQDLMTRTRLGVGTPAYMAPEQFDDQGNRQSDIYSLCATFYELFTRRRLYDHDRTDLAEVNRRKRDGVTPESPRSLRREIPWEVEALLLGGLNADPGLRPTGRRLADDVRRIRENRPIHYRRPGLHRRVGLWYRRNRSAVRVAAPALAVLAVLALVFGLSWLKAERRSGEIGKQVDTLARKAETEEGRANAEERLKFLQQYVADMRLLPELWKNARIDLIRDRLRAYADGRPDDPRGFEWYYWDRLVNAASPTWNAGDAIRSLDWSLDGRTLLVADARGRLLSWDRSTGASREVRDADSGTIVVASASRAPRLAVVASRVGLDGRESSSIAVLDAATGKALCTIPAPVHPFRAAALSPDGRRLLTSDHLADLLVWNAESGQARIDLIHNSNARRSPLSSMMILDTHTGAVYALAFNPADKAVVASGGEDGAIGLWNTETGRCMGWLARDLGPVASVAFSRDGKIVVGHALARPADRSNRGARPAEIALWRVASGERIRRIEISDEHDGMTSNGRRIRSGNFRVDFVHDDRWIASASGNVARVWDFGTGLLVKELKGHAASIRSLRASPDGSSLATADETGEVRVWDLDRSDVMETIARFQGPAYALARPSSSNGRLVVIHEGPGSFSSDGSIAPGGHSELLVLDPSGHAVPKTERTGGDDPGIVTSPGGKRRAAFDTIKDEITVRETVGGKVIRVFPVAPRRARPKGAARDVDVRCLAFRSEDELYAVTEEGLRRWRIEESAEEWIGALPVGSSPKPTMGVLIVPENAVMALSFSADGRRAAVGTAGRLVIVYDAETWKEQARLARHSRGITGVSFSPDGRRLASSSGRYVRSSAREAGDQAGEVIVWDTATWQDCLTLTRPEASEFAGVTFGDAGLTLFAAANPVTVSPGRLPHGEVVRWSAGRPADVPPPSPPPARSRPLEGVAFRATNPFTGAGSSVGFTSVAVHPSGELIAAVGVTGRLILWDVRSGEAHAEAVLPSAPVPGYEIQFAPGGSHLLCVQGKEVIVRSIPDLREVDSEPESPGLKPDIPATVLQVKVGERSFPIQPGRFTRDLPPISRDGQLVAVATPGDSPTLRVFSIPKRSLVCSLPLGDPPLRVGFSTNGERVYAVTRPAAGEAAPPTATFRSWEIPAGRSLGTIPGIRNLVAVSPALETSVEYIGGMELYARDLSTGRRASAPFAVEPGLRGIDFFPDGEHVATFGGQNWTTAWKVTRPLKVPQNLLFRTASPWHVLASPDGQTIAYKHPSGSIAAFDLSRGRTTRLAFDPTPPASTKPNSRGTTPSADYTAWRGLLLPWSYASDGRTLFASSMQGEGHDHLTAFDLGRGVETPIDPRPEEIRPPGLDPKRDFRPVALAMQATTGSRVLYFLKDSHGAISRKAGDDSPYRLWDGQQARALPELAETTITPRISAFGPLGHHLAVVKPRQTRRVNRTVEQSPPEVIVLAVDDGRVVARIPCGGNVVSVRFTRYEVMLLVHERGDRDPAEAPSQSIAAYERRTGREAFRTSFPGTAAPATSDDGRIAAFVDADGSIAIESLPGRARLARIAHDDGAMYPLAFLPGGAGLITSGANYAIRLWDVATGRPVPRPASASHLVDQSAEPAPAAPAPPRTVARPARTEAGRTAAAAPAPPRMATRPARTEAGKLDRARLVRELSALATRLKRTPQGGYHGRLPVLGNGCEKLAGKLTVGQAPTEQIAREMARFIQGAKDLKEQGKARSPYKDFCTTYKDGGKGDDLPGYKAEFFRNRRELLGKPFRPARESSMQYGQRLFAEMVMMLEGQIEELTGKLPESSLLEEWRKADPASGPAPAGGQPGRDAGAGTTKPR